MIRRIKHWFGHEWVDDPNPYQTRRMVTQRCAYPGCTWTTLLDKHAGFRFGQRKN